MKGVENEAPQETYRQKTEIRSVVEFSHDLQSCRQTRRSRIESAGEEMLSWTVFRSLDLWKRMWFFGPTVPLSSKIMFVSLKKKKFQTNPISQYICISVLTKILTQRHSDVKVDLEFLYVCPLNCFSLVWIIERFWYVGPALHIAHLPGQGSWLHNTLSLDTHLRKRDYPYGQIGP